MSKKLRFVLFFSLALLLLGLLLNIETTSMQGVNFVLHARKIPLYLKLSNFFDRHLNYRELISEMISSSDSEEVRVLKIFTWTNKNIALQPKDLPVIDDHVWHIIVRGYGISDQFSDVFTTLCNYAAIEAFFKIIESKNSSAPFSFVKIKNRWVIFDPYNGIYFRNKIGELADLKDIRSGNWQVVSAEEASFKKQFDYRGLFSSFPEDIIDTTSQRARIQSPLNRLMFEMKKWLRIKSR